MAYFTNRTSTTSTSTFGGAFPGQFVGFSSLPITPPPPPPKPKPSYSGTLLPAVIYILDLELDLEQASYEELARSVDRILQSTTSRQTLAQTVLQGLEAKFADQVAVLKEIQKRHAAAHEALAAAQQGRPPVKPASEQSPEEMEAERQKYLAKAREQEANLDKELKASKKSGSKAKKIFRKLAALCHPDKTGNDEVLADIFRAGKIALELSDAQAMQQLLDQALAYKSGNKKLNRLNQIKLNKTKVKERLNAAWANDHQFNASFLAQILAASKQGDAAVHQLFLQVIENTKAHLSQQTKMFEQALNPTPQARFTNITGFTFL